jgi:hypothetical protein
VFVDYQANLAQNSMTSRMIIFSKSETDELSKGTGRSIVIKVRNGCLI